MVNKIHCAYCQKELNRLVFCNSSHKVMYHRKEIEGVAKTVSDVQEQLKKLPKVDKPKFIKIEKKDVDRDFKPETKVRKLVSSWSA